MKCKNCHGEIDTNEKNCPYCNYNEMKDNKYYSVFQRYIFFLMRYKQVISIVFIFAFLMFILEFFLDSLGLSGIILTIIAVIETILIISAVIFVGIIGVVLIINGINYININNNIEVTTGRVVDNKNEKEIFIGGKGYLPIIEYEVNNNKYRCFGDNNKKKSELGIEYQVFYNTFKPYVGSIHKHKTGWISLLVGIFILLVILLILFI